MRITNEHSNLTSLSFYPCHCNCHPLPCCPVQPYLAGSCQRILWYQGQGKKQRTTQIGIDTERCFVGTVPHCMRRNVNFTITRVTHDSLLLDISANKLDGHQEQLPPVDRMPIPMDLIESWHKHSWRDVLLIFPLSHIYKKKRPEWTNFMRNPCARWSSGEPIKRQKHWSRQKLTKSEQKQMKLNQDGVR